MIVQKNSRLVMGRFERFERLECCVYWLERRANIRLKARE